MKKIGAKLRDARLARGMSIEDIAQVTKIPHTTVTALEADRDEDLPAPVFVRGFIRAYAKTVGLDSGPLVRELDLALMRDRRDDDPDDAPRRRRARSATGLGPTTVSLGHGGGGGSFGRGAGSGLPGGYMLLVVVALGLLIAGWLLVGGKHQAESTSESAGPVVPLIQERVDGVSPMTDTTVVDPTP